MTKDKEEKNKKSNDNEPTKHTSVEESKGDAVPTHSIKAENSAQNEIEKVELLEQKEGAGLQLEFFSKEELFKQIRELEEKVKSKDEKIKNLEPWKDKYMRLQAEFENTQKRWDKNRQYLKSQYTATVLKNFLPLYDSFKKALESTSENDQLRQFYSQFMNILKFEGATPMETKINDSYNYNFHEAITSIEKDDIEENRILDIIQEGWKFGKEVLRYAKVVISRKPKPPESKLESKIEPEAQSQEQKPVGTEVQSETKDKENSKKDSSEGKEEKNSKTNDNNYIS